MIFSVRLTITHSYDQPAANSRHVIRVLPRTIPGRQNLTTHVLDISPGPDSRTDMPDFFGNAVTRCAHTAPHADMAIKLTSYVDMAPPARWRDLSTDTAQLRKDWEAVAALSADAPIHFLGPTPRLTTDKTITAFALDVFDPNISTVANVIAIGEALHTAMTFDASATTVDTDAAEAFRLKRGVCQDFSHIMILALQALGIPAGYVSGYLRTLPPPGGEKLEGVDAMHAWVRAWGGPKQGWIEYDPTNATLVSTDHIVVGYGRDYADVSPLLGHLRSSGGQKNAQAVDVAVAG